MKLSPALKSTLRCIHAGRAGAKASTRRALQLGLLDVDPTIPTDHKSLIIEVTLRAIDGRTPYVLTRDAKIAIGVPVEAAVGIECPHGYDQCPTCDGKPTLSPSSSHEPAEGAKEKG